MNITNETKTWGLMQNLFLKNNVEICRAEVKKGKNCSKHRHKFKYNGFFVEKGKLIVRSWKNGPDSSEEAVLNAGNFTVIAPNVLHRFEALEDTVVYEIYWAELEKGDIEKET